MTFYKIIPNSDKFYSVKSLDKSLNDFQNKFYEVNLKQKWKPLKASFIKKGICGDFASLIGFVVCTQKSFIALSPLVSDEIEFLELLVDTHKYYILNVIRKVPLDIEKSKFVNSSSGRIIMIDQYAFKDSDIKDMHIFNIEGVLSEGPLVSQKFKDLVEKNNLEGLIFKKIC